VLGGDLLAGQRLQHVVPPGCWFGAAPCDGTEYALVGCTVAPGACVCVLRGYAEVFDAAACVSLDP
jgi:hypothetical protein